MQWEKVDLGQAKVRSVWIYLGEHKHSLEEQPICVFVFCFVCFALGSDFSFILTTSFFHAAI